MAPTCRISQSQKFCFSVKKALPLIVFWENNNRFGSLTSHVINGKLGKRIGETIFSLHKKKSMKVNIVLFKVVSKRILCSFMSLFRLKKALPRMISS